MVRSIGVDPFKMVYFMEEEFGKVTMQNRVMNPSHERTVKAYIDHYTKGHYTTTGTVAMRQTNVTIDGKPTYGLTFITGIIPDYSIPLRDIVYIPTTTYPRGMFVFLEDAIGDVLRNLRSVFDEDLQLERDLPAKHQFFLSLLRKNRKGSEAITSDAEAGHILIQSETIDHLKTFFDAMLSSTTYSHFRTVGSNKMAFDLFSSLTDRIVEFVGELDLRTPIPSIVKSGKDSLTVCVGTIDFSTILTYTAFRRLLRTLNPGLVDDRKGFDRKVTRRLLAQHLYNHDYRNADQGAKEGEVRLTSEIAKPVDTILRYMDLIDRDDFQALALEDKVLEYDKLSREVEMQIQEEKC